jgi:glutamate decarboxylase
VEWRARQEAAGKDTTRPNLVFGGDVHVVWEKFCRYFDVEPRIIPLQPDKYVIGPEDVEPHVDENTIGVAAVLGTTFTGHADDIVGINDLLVRLNEERGLDVPIHVDAASGGFVWPFLYPHTEWDFRLPQVRSINVSGHKFGLVYPGIGWLVFRERSDLPEDPRVLRELPGQAGRHVHVELLHGLLDGPGPVLQLRPLRPRRLPLHHGDHAGQRAPTGPADRSDR